MKKKITLSLLKSVLGPSVSHYFSCLSISLTIYTLRAYNFFLTWYQQIGEGWRSAGGTILWVFQVPKIVW